MSPFLWIGTLPFFCSDGKAPFSRHWLKIISRGLQIERLHTFNLRLPVLPWPCALLGSRLWIPSAILSWEKVTHDRRLSIKYVISDGSFLLLLIKEGCVGKWKLKSSAFYLKSVTNLFSWSKGWIRGIFCCLKVALAGANMPHNYCRH